MTTDDKIKDEKLQYDIKSSKKYQHYRQVILMNMNISQVKKYYYLIKE